MFICGFGMHNNVQGYRNAKVCKQTYDASCTASHVGCLLQVKVPGRCTKRHDSLAIPSRLQAQPQQLLAYPEQQKLTARLACLCAACLRRCCHTLGCRTGAAPDKMPLNPGRLSMQLLSIPSHDLQCYDIVCACLFAKVKGRDNDKT